MPTLSLTPLTKCQQFGLALVPCMTEELGRAANADANWQVYGLTQQVIWFQRSLAFSILLLAGGIAGSVIENNIGWNAAAALGGVFILMSGSVLHDKTRAIVAALNAMARQQHEQQLILIETFSAPRPSAGEEIFHV